MRTYGVALNRGKSSCLLQERHSRLMHKAFGASIFYKLSQGSDKRFFSATSRSGFEAAFKDSS